MESMKNLLLSEVQIYNPDCFSNCKVHYNGIAGEGRNWAYKAGGNSFEYEITPVQAIFLSQLQDFMFRQLTLPELKIVESIPSELIGIKGKKFFHVTGSAQVAQYDLLE